MESSKMKIAKKSYIVFCDDVRDEIGGKLSLMGIYSDKIVLPAIPTALKSLNIVVFLEGLKKNFKTFRVLFELPGAKPIDATASPPPEKNNKKNANIVFGIATLKIESVGIATAKVYLDDADSPEVEKELEITVLPKPTIK